MIAMLLALAAGQHLPMPTFLAGCWKAGEEADWSEECWTSPRGGKMAGAAVTGTGSRTTIWEWMRVERDADGTPTFYASPAGAPPSPFKAVRATATEFEVVNAAHDYPQRVHYRLTAEGLDAEISLADGSKPARWRYRRAGTPPQIDQPTISSSLKK